MTVMVTGFLMTKTPSLATLQLAWILDEDGYPDYWNPATEQLIAESDYRCVSR